MFASSSSFVGWHVTRLEAPDSHGQRSIRRNHGGRMPMPPRRTAARACSARGFSKAHHDDYTTQTNGRVPGVATSGYYERLDNPLSEHLVEDARRRRPARVSFTAIHDILGETCRVFDARDGREARRKHRIPRATTEANLQAFRSDLVRRQFVGRLAILIARFLRRRSMTAGTNGELWTGFTHIRAWPVWPYQAVVVDPSSRRTVRRTRSHAIHREVVLDGVPTMVRQRRPLTTLAHLASATQYGNDAWRRMCRIDNHKPSRIRNGRPGTVRSLRPISVA